jgi:tight adherence protein B
VSGWLGSDAVFPQRSLVLSVSPARTLTPSQVALTENGARLPSFTLRRVADGGPGDAGVMLVVDDNAASPSATLPAEMSAVRSLATVRPADELLGLTRFDIADETLLTPTANAQKVKTALSTDPVQGPGANVPGAIHSAVDALAGAKVADGVVIVVSDGIAVQGTPVKDALATALAHHIQIITVGLKDARATKSSLAALSKASPGVFETATPAQLAPLLRRLQHNLSDDYVARWKSAAPYASAITVQAGVSGFTGGVSATYRSPAAPPPPVHKARSRTHRRARTAPTVASSLLSPYPSFAPQSIVPPVTTNPSFWASPDAVPAVAVGVALMLAATILLILKRPSERAARNRVGSFIPIETIENYLNVQSDVPAPAAAITNLQQGKWWPSFVDAVEISRNPHSPTFLIRRAAIIGVLLALVLGVVMGSIVLALVPLLAWPFVVRWMVMRGAEKQRARFRDGLPNYIQDVASAMRVGRSFPAAISIVASGCDEPAKSEFERAATDESLGRPLEDTLENIATRMRSDAMEQIALIAGLHRRTGSNVAESLDRVAEGARDRADLRREMGALTSQAKMSSLVLTGLPGVLLVGLALVSPRYAHPLFHTTVGNVALGFGAVLVAIGWKVMSNITRVQV